MLHVHFAALANSNAVGQTPIMGWSGYNALMQDSGHCDKAGAAGYNETTFQETAAVLASTGMRELGYVYMNLDDCWIAENRSGSGKLLADPTRFPHGMTWLADKAHSLGLKLGLYAAASEYTCRSFPGSQGFEEIDASTFASWGADFVKLDSCSRTFLANGTESWANQYTRWAAALNASGRQMVFSCSWAVYWTSCAAKYPPAEWASQCGDVPWEDNTIADACHLWRYGSDLQPYWGEGAAAPESQRILSGAGGRGVGDIIEFASSIFAYNWRAVTGPGATNDPDFLVVGCPTDRPCGGVTKPYPPLSDIEQRTQFSVWCLLAAPLIIGSDIRNLTSTALATLTNAKAIAINQDPAGFSPRLVAKRVGGAHAHQVWVRPLQGGDVAAALINTGTAPMDITLQLHGVLCATCAPRATVSDMWEGDTTLGSAGPPSPVVAEGSFTAVGVRPHETVLLRLSPA